MSYRLSCLCLAIFAASASSLAQFDRPAPLAWRWGPATPPLASVPKIAPIVDGNSIYLPSGNRIYALAKDTGNVLWHFPSGATSTGTFRFPVVLHEGILYASSDSRQTFAIDATTGERKWMFTSLQPVRVEPVVVGRYLMLAYTDNSLQAIDLETGEPAWENPIRQFGDLIAGMAGADNNVILFNSANEMMSVHAGTQKIVWRLKFSQIDQLVRPVIYNDMIYVGSGPYLVAASAVSGTARWQTHVGEQIAYPPIVSADGILFATREGKLGRYDLSGRRVSKEMIGIGSAVTARPTYSGRNYLVTTANGSINLVDGKTNESIWSFSIPPMDQPAPGQPNRIVNAAATPVVAGQTLLVVADDGSLLAFDRSLGVDLTPPDLALIWPGPGDVVSGQPPLEIIFRITDEGSGINPKSLVVEMDGKPVAFDYYPEGWAVIRISLTGKTKPLMDGRRIFTVAVSDWLGNLAYSKFTLVIDNTLRPIPRPGSVRIPNTPPARGGTGGGGAGDGGAG